MAINQSATKIDTNQFSDSEKLVLSNVWKMQQLREGIMEVQKLKSIVEDESPQASVGGINPTALVELEPIWEKLDDLHLFLTLKLGCLLADSTLPSLPKEFQKVFNKLRTDKASVS